MSKNADFHIEVDAAKALIYWKSLFADEVATRARQLAAESSQPDRVTLAHYRQAAQLAIRSLPASISKGEPFGDDHPETQEMARHVDADRRPRQEA
jgi:hypothetical protein